ncbi:hypothetical protein [Cryobacterium fucosi]|uniref:hypothetical protein n=1 Tax=Cryobacterium fucosi TaxID=1259157 RepID=UPI00141AC082|nr:hypothetical protein [Cryobacterium fucosi]
MRLRIFTEPQQGASYDDTLAGLAAEGIECAYLQIMDLTDLDHLDFIAREVMPQLS